MMKGRMPTRDAGQGDVVYRKYKNTNVPLTLELLGRITTIDAEQATVRWHDGSVSEHLVRELVSVTKKLAIAKHDVERFSGLIAALKRKEQTDVG